MYFFAECRGLSRKKGRQEYFDGWKKWLSSDLKCACVYVSRIDKSYLEAVLEACLLVYCYE